MPDGRICIHHDRKSSACRAFGTPCDLINKRCERKKEPHSTSWRDPSKGMSWETLAELSSTKVTLFDKPSGRRRT